MTTIQTIITAAKDSRSLFIAAGFGEPKSLVHWQEREVLLRAMGSYVVNPESCWVAVNRDEDREWFISDRVRQAFPTANLVSVPSGVQGALASALIAMQGVDLDEPLVVAAGDSMIEGGLKPYIDRFVGEGADAGTVAFKSTNPRWSYLSVDSDGTLRQVAEKRVIGNLATTGAFFFRSAGDFVDAATWCLVNNASHNGMYFVSSTLNYMISQNRRVNYLEIAREQYKSWSLPIDFTMQSE
jgi:hypothetical protein